MIIKWNPSWYELDQSIAVGDTGYFYLQKDAQTFANGPVSTGDQKVEATILGITHPILGPISRILTAGLDYSFVLENGEVILVNAEEEPGTIYDQQLHIDDWSMDVDVQILKVTDLSSQD